MISSIGTGSSAASVPAGDLRRLAQRDVRGVGGEDVLGRHVGLDDLLDPDAGRGVLGAAVDAAQVRLGDVALRVVQRAARAERAARLDVDQRRRRALDRGQPGLLAGVDARHRAEQADRVGHPGAVEDVLDGALLDRPARVHDQDPVDHAGDHAEVVGDQHGRRAGLLLCGLEHLEDLRLHGHVERGGRLVGDDHLGLVGHRDRDDHALAHAAGELVRVGVDPGRRVGDADELEQVDRAGPGRRSATATCRAGGRVSAICTPIL